MFELFICESGIITNLSKGFLDTFSFVRIIRIWTPFKKRLALYLKEF